MVGIKDIYLRTWGASILLHDWYFMLHFRVKYSHLTPTDFPTSLTFEIKILCIIIFLIFCAFVRGLRCSTFRLKPTQVLSFFLLHPVYITALYFTNSYVSGLFLSSWALWSRSNSSFNESIYMYHRPHHNQTAQGVVVFFINISKSGINSCNLGFKCCSYQSSKSLMLSQEWWLIVDLYRTIHTETICFKTLLYE